MTNELSTIAEALWIGRSQVLEVDQDNLDRFGTRLNIMTRAHLMRSVLQSLAIAGRINGFRLVDRYLSFGRVELVYEAEQQHYLLKARSALRFVPNAQGSFFGADQSSGINPLQVLLYEIRADGFRFGTVRAEQRLREGRHELVILDQSVTEEGTWSSEEPHRGPERPFDQGALDDFGDLSGGVEIDKRLGL